MKKLVKKVIFLLSIISIIGILSTTETRAQCAMCKAAVTAGSEESAGGVGKTLNMAILYLMGIPYVLAGVGAFVWWKKNKQAKAEEAAAND